MKREAVYDKALGLEACRFRELVQPFPNHFHDHYVIGLVEAGRRALACKGHTYAIGPGSVLLFAPGDSHGCTQSGTLDYRGLSVSREAMLDWMEEATGRRIPPAFSAGAVRDGVLAQSLAALHTLVMADGDAPEREEAWLLFLSELVRTCGQSVPSGGPDCRREAERARAFIEEHYAERIGLEEICLHAGLSRSTLLRVFTRAWGVTPYRYLESIRVDRAKALLARGISLTEAALRVGFSDQSHFTNYFTSFTGLSPGAYRSMFQASREAHKED